MRKYREIVCAAYKDLDHPDFSFVKKVLHARPYEPLIRKLRDFFAIEELSEAEDDVCFSYLLKGQTALWKLDLSVVGPYGILVRLRNPVRATDFLVLDQTDRIDLTGPERKVLDLLRLSGIKLLGVDELSISVPITLYNTEKSQAKLYHALFSDREALPWEA